MTGLSYKVTDSSPMLAGICSRLANRLGWNVWAIRAVLLIVLVVEPLIAALGYAVAALLFGVVERGGKIFSPRPAAGDEQASELQSPELSLRKQRIDELEQRFRSWEQNLPKD